jgi:hypothetical protein
MGMNKMLCDKIVGASRFMQMQFAYARVNLLNSFERTEIIIIIFLDRFITYACVSNYFTNINLIIKFTEIIDKFTCGISISQENALAR